MKGILDFIFPPFCEHCAEYACLANSFFCASCTALLKPIDPTFRCRHCFEELQEGGPLCPLCCKKPKSAVIRGAVFDSVGPGSVLGHAMRRGAASLIKTIASYMVYQWSELKWDLPDVITCLTPSFAERILQKGQSAEDLAKGTAQMLQVPFQKLLKIKSQGFLQQQAYLAHESCLFGKTILVIAIYPMANSLLGVLQKGFPKKVYALSFIG